jgi:hypothetical protein
MICASCGNEQQTSVVVWLAEDGFVECPECHSESVAGDPYDRDYHGHPYVAGELENSV